MHDALLIVDMQQEMRRRIEEGAEHVSSSAISNIERLLYQFRRRGWPVVHVQHNSSSIDSPFHIDSSGYPFIETLKPCGEEPLFIKSTSSAFNSTSLEGYLKENGIDHLVVAGAVAGYCVNTTVRDGCDLGFHMSVISDAVLEFGFPMKGISAQSALDTTFAYLEADFAKIVTTHEYLTS